MRLGFFLILVSFNACSVIVPKQSTTSNYSKYLEDPLTPAETKELIGVSMENWAYGQGLGDSAVKVGTSVIFPPFLIVWLGNTAIEAAGYEVQTPKQFDTVYEGITSIPGHVTSKISGQEFHNQEIKNNNIKAVLNKHENPIDLSDV